MAISSKGAYIRDLLVRMNSRSLVPAPEGGFTGKESFDAHREAEQLQDAEYLPFLMAEAESTRNGFQVLAAAFCIGNLAKNINSAEAYEFLLTLAERERRVFPKSRLLADLALPAVPISLCERTLSLAHSLLVHKNWQVRWEAANLTCHLADPRSVPLLLELLDSSPDRYELANLMRALGQCGDANLIATLLPFTNHNVQDVAWSATYSIGELGKTDATPVLAEILLTSRLAKGCAIWRLHEYGDARAIEAVLQRTKSLFAKPQKLITDERVLGLEYLSRFTSDERVVAFFSDVRLRMWKKLRPEEKVRLITNVATFADLPL